MGKWALAKDKAWDNGQYEQCKDIMVLTTVRIIKHLTQDTATTCCNLNEMV